MQAMKEGAKKKTYDLLRGRQDDYRGFAKQYIERRLAENKSDAIEELSAYLGNWLWYKARVKEFLKKAS